MTERAISYLLLLAATVAVLLVVVIQPRNTLVQKQRMLQGINPNLAQTCMMGNMTCDEYQAMLCDSQGGTWNSNLQSCTPPATTCSNGACTEQMCLQMGYGWNGTSCIIPSSGSGSSGDVAAIGGVSANEQLAQRIESQCLAHVEKSGYGETVRKYGWYNNIRTYANNACTYAYLATNGKYGSNNDLYLIPNLIANDYAVRQEDIGMLYQALEDVPAQSKGQSLDDYLNPAKDGAAKRLKDIMDIMAAYNDLTTDQKANPAWLAEPMPHTTKDAAAKWNAQYGTKITSLEEKLLALLPKPEEKIIDVPEKTPEPEAIIPEPQKEPVKNAVKAAEPEPVPSLRQRVEAVFVKVVNRLKGIREQGLETGIARTTIQRDINALRKDFLHTQEIIKTFDACLKDGVC